VFVSFDQHYRISFFWRAESLPASEVLACWDHLQCWVAFPLLVAELDHPLGRHVAYPDLQAVFSR